ncbi:sensor histidine kinase [Flavobacteriaceae bacterium F08102]|nr:sensor histidine kinase [Flavobacteriaceae bacterium F08102]
MSLKYFLYLFLIFIGFFGWSQNTQKTDSIEIYIDLAKKSNNSPVVASKNLGKALKLTRFVKNDSAKTSYYIKIGYRYMTVGDYEKFRELNTKARKLSNRIKDTLQFAETYWDLGAFFSNISVYDSAYYAFNEAKKHYEAVGNKFYVGRMLLNMAITQTKIEDYTGSEVTTFLALDVLKGFKANRQIYGCYNNLGIVYNELDDFESSLEYYFQALKYLDGVKGRNTSEIGTLNNIGVVYEKNKDYVKALEYYNKALAVSDPKDMRKDQYAMLLDNITYIHFKQNKKEGIEEGFLKSLAIRDSIEDYFGQAINKLHLAEFYMKNNDSVRALKELKENYELTKKTNNYRDLLATLKLLMVLDHKNSANYALAYMNLTDNLQKEERKIRNKFARIQYETEEIQHKTNLLAKENRRLWWIGGLLLLLLTAGFVIRAQTLKNRNLEMERSQQASNEEIYAVMLNQQQQIEQIKSQEKRRISEELHDGVLGKLFGTRLLLETINRNSDEESILLREKHIQDLREIEEEVRNVSHELHEKSFDIKESFVQMLENLVNDQSKISNFNYHLSIEVDWQKLDSSLKMNVFRILQEAIQNINKYAKAENVWIKFEEVKSQLRFTVVDDGVGFNISKQKKGIGLKNIISRVSKLSGTVKFDSEINRGTQILIEIPI